jgi:hypothetical protein
MRSLKAAVCGCAILVSVGSTAALKGRATFEWGSPFGLPVTQQPTAEWVANQIENRDTGRDSRAEVRMRLYDRQGRVRERTMTMLAMRGAGGREDKSLVRFAYPNDIKNTAFLVWEHAGADDERFLYLPALGRVRRIAGEEKQQSFVGSDLTYEDMGGRDTSDYTFSFVDQNASWTGPGGTKHPAWSLE